MIRYSSLKYLNLKNAQEIVNLMILAHLINDIHTHTHTHITLYKMQKMNSTRHT